MFYIYTVQFPSPFPPKIRNSLVFGPAVFDIEHRARKIYYTHTSTHTHTLWRHSPRPKLPMVSHLTHTKVIHLTTSPPGYGSQEMSTRLHHDDR